MQRITQLVVARSSTSSSSRIATTSRRTGALKLPRSSQPYHATRRQLCAPQSPPAAPQPKGTRGGKPAGSPVGWVSLGLTMVVGGGVLAFYRSEKDRMLRERLEKIHGEGMPHIGGDFNLLDENNKRRSNEEFLGKYMLVYFGFTHCPDICPAELEKMASCLKVLDADPDVGPDKIQPIFITVDPKRDTVANIKSYTQEFHKRILALTGSHEEIKNVTKAYRVYFSIPDDAEEDYLVDHSIIIYLMGPDGKFVKFFGQMTPVEEMISEIKQTLSEK